MDRGTLAITFKAKFRRSGLVLAFLALCVVLSILSDRFLTLPNALNILRETVTTK